jgi:hypothetical protein
MSVVPEIAHEWTTLQRALSALRVQHREAARGTALRHAECTVLYGIP